MRIGTALRAVLLIALAVVVGEASSPIHPASRQIPRAHVSTSASWSSKDELDEHQLILAAVTYQKWLDRQPTTPIRLLIKRIGVDAAIETVGLTASSRVDTPGNPWDVAWYNGSVRPGSSGLSFIDGHYDTATSRAVFYRLRELVQGDEIDVVDDRGRVRAFVVSSTDQIGANTPLYFPTDGPPQLVLMTCDGSWDRAQQTYSLRRIVQATYTP